MGLSPITCIEFNNERYIVDGLKRYQVGKALGIAELPYTVISPNIVIVDVIKELQAHNFKRLHYAPTPFYQRDSTSI